MAAILPVITASIKPGTTHRLCRAPVRAPPTAPSDSTGSRTLPPCKRSTPYGRRRDSTKTS